MTDRQEIVEPQVDQQRSAPSDWWRRTSAGAVALILGLGTLWVLQLLAWPLALLIGGVALAAALAPLVERLANWLPRTLAIVLIYLVTLLFFIGLGWFVFPTLATEAGAAYQRLPELVNTFQERINSWLPAGVDLSNLVPTQMGGATGLLISVPQQVMDWLTAIVVVVFVSLYALILSPATRDFFLSLFPRSGRNRAQEVVQRMVEAMGGFVRGTIIDALIVGVLTYVGLLLIGIDYAVVLAVLAGLLEIIPVLGPFLTAVLIVIVGLTQSTTKGLLGFGFAVLLQQIESNILVPNIMRTQAHVSPLMTLLAVLAGARIGGLVGALIAIPLVAAVRVFVLEVVAPSIRDWTGAPPIEEDRED